jgi:PIN domain nuclease of toxin-antitoxin system
MNFTRAEPLTNTVIRLRQNERSIDARTRRIIENAAAVFVSSASIWETAIKTSARKLKIDIGRLEAAFPGIRAAASLKRVLR